MLESQQATKDHWRMPNIVSLARIQVVVFLQLGIARDDSCVFRANKLSNVSHEVAKLFK